MKANFTKIIRAMNIHDGNIRVYLQREISDNWTMLQRWKNMAVSDVAAVLDRRIQRSTSTH